MMMNINRHISLIILIGNMQSKWINIQQNLDKAKHDDNTMPCVKVSSEEKAIIWKVLYTG